MIIISEKINLNTKVPFHLKSNREIFFSKYKDKFDNISEFIYYYKNPEKAESERYCKVCGKKNKFIGRLSKYRTYCSHKCANTDKTILHNRIQKSKETKLFRYGTSGYNNSQKRRKTMLNTIDEKGLNLYQKGLLKREKTNILKYGDANYNNSEKRIQSSLIKHENGLSSFEQAAIKRAKTSLLLYGTKTYSQTEECKKRVYSTLKRNKTFTTSKKEEEVNVKLISKFGNGDVIRQYKSKEYPFRCDFYIPSKDLYIECNFYFGHGKEPFDNNNEQHKQLLSIWKSKSIQYPKYKDAINIWTKRDPLKINTFKENKLNYKIFYNMKQFSEWFDMI